MTTTTWIILALILISSLGTWLWWLSRKPKAPQLSDSQTASTAPPTPSVPHPRVHAPQPQHFVTALAKSRAGFMARVADLIRQHAHSGAGKSEQDALYRDLETTLLSADVGATTTSKLLQNMTAQAEQREGLLDILRQDMLHMLKQPTRPAPAPTGLHVWMLVGVNGVGKTTTAAKLAQHHLAQGKTVVLAAADTFRAAAVAQLQTWADRMHVEVVTGKEGADPASVAFDAIRKARELEADIVLIDTAGRLHTKAPLMEELKKVHRSCEKALGRPVDETLLVLDATSGQNAVQQAATFQEALPLTGLVLTKLDGTAKGGVVLAVSDQLGLAVRYVGLGEGMNDLAEFNPQAFVDALFALSTSE